MTPAAILYETAQRLLRAATPLFARGSSKVAKALAGRHTAGRSLVAWGRGHRVADRPGAWFHAPSVGEGLQARAVLEALQARRPELQAVYTHFSPSAEELARRMPAAWSGYLPWDLPDETSAALSAVRPGLVCFTKTEVWPVLVREASELGIPVALVGGTVPPGAGRSRWPARTLLRPTWARLSLVGAMTAEDAEGFAQLGVAASVIRVTGDPAVDAAAARARGARRDAPYLRPFLDDPRPTVVAGSVWPSDLRVLLPALEGPRAQLPGLRVILAPHEPTPEGVAGIQRMLESLGWMTRTLSWVEEHGSVGVDVVVVDRVGVLAPMYTLGRAAYVGGGFHGAGLHSVLEPAAAGAPVAFGPRHRNARAAAALADVGGGRAVQGAGGLGDVLCSWLTDDAAHDFATRGALGYIDGHLGAAERTAILLDELLT